jgi:hypothetical protein
LGATGFPLAEQQRFVGGECFNHGPVNTTKVLKLSTKKRNGRIIILVVSQSYE